MKLKTIQILEDLTINNRPCFYIFTICTMLGIIALTDGDISLSLLTLPFGIGMFAIGFVNARNSRPKPKLKKRKRWTEDMQYQATTGSYNALSVSRSKIVVNKNGKHKYTQALGLHTGVENSDSSSFGQIYFTLPKAKQIAKRINKIVKELEKRENSL